MEKTLPQILAYLNVDLSKKEVLMIDAMMVNGTVKDQLCMDRKDCVENILVLGLARLMLCFEEDIRKETIHFVDMLGKGENIKSYEMWLVDRGIQIHQLWSSELPTYESIQCDILNAICASKQSRSVQEWYDILQVTWILWDRHKISTLAIAALENPMVEPSSPVLNEFLKSLIRKGAMVQVFEFIEKNEFNFSHTIDEKCTLLQPEYMQPGAMNIIEYLNHKTIQVKDTLEDSEGYTVVTTLEQYCKNIDSNSWSSAISILSICTYVVDWYQGTLPEWKVQNVEQLRSLLFATAELEKMAQSFGAVVVCIKSRINFPWAKIAQEFRRIYSRFLFLVASYHAACTDNFKKLLSHYLQKHLTHYHAGHTTTKELSAFLQTMLDTFFEPMWSTLLLFSQGQVRAGKFSDQLFYLIESIFLCKTQLKQYPRNSNLVALQKDVDHIAMWLNAKNIYKKQLHHLPRLQHILRILTSNAPAPTSLKAIAPETPASQSLQHLPDSAFWQHYTKK